MIAGEDIPVSATFAVVGVNFTNPVTREDTGHEARFMATREIKSGEMIQSGDFYPAMRADGPFRNVSREPFENEFARLR